jgi:TolB-like protein/thioredoxin-like negative regulator of GroEL
VADAPTQREGEGAWSKLRRRKVVQWGIAYGAGAWAMLQGVAYLRDTFGWVYQIQQLATLLLLIVLPIVLVLAWYHGDRGQQRVTVPELALLTALLLVGGALFWWLGRMVEPPVAGGVAVGPASSPPVAAVARDDRSIAVLPFANMSSDPEQEYFSDGVAEQVLDQLSRIPDLRVIARTSSFTFRGKDVDVPTIAQKLNVSHVLEGSVRKSGNRVRITAQLIKAADSSQLWSETYDRELTDIFAVQDEIAAGVVRQLKVTLLGGELPARKTTASVEAYNLYLQGRYMYDRHGEQDMARAAGLYRQALAIDPSYAAAWAALAQAQWVPADLGYTDVNEGARDALESSQKALTLDPQNAQAHLVTGLVQFAHEYDWAAADRSFQRALANDPGASDAMLGAGFLALGLGRVDEAAALFQRAVEHSPVSPSPRVWRGLAYATSNHLDEAEREIRAALQLSDRFSSGWYWLGVVLLSKGEPEAALAAMQTEPVESWRLPGLSLAYHALSQHAASDAALKQGAESFGTFMAYQIGQAHAYRGEVDEAFAWLDRAYHQRDAGLAYFLKTDPLLDNIRADPRYAALLLKLELPRG